MKTQEKCNITGQFKLFKNACHLLALILMQGSCLSSVVNTIGQNGVSGHIYAKYKYWLYIDRVFSVIVFILSDAIMTA